jgi:hypothetical protein
MWEAKLGGAKTMKFRKMARSLIERQGYAVYKEEFQPYGFSPFVKIRRLLQRLDYPIQIFFDVGRTPVRPRQT